MIRCKSYFAAIVMLLLQSLSTFSIICVFLIKCDDRFLAVINDLDRL